ncbi:MAG: glutaminyl-peptide cyclotransferase [Chitinophagaceae bacterium]|nr:MAG: glutaminyl-peptide cyclotransferase [Chitinophagaceae bacterium]
MKVKSVLSVLLVFVLLVAAVAPVINSCNSNDKPSTPVNGNGETKITGPKNLSYSILDSFPHDTSSFTQGLAFYKGELYEGTGEYGRSKLLKAELKTGKIVKQILLDKKYFGEGITIFNDTIYQLTWKENVVFAYSLKDFKKIKEFTINTEGWGITHNGKELIVTDGGSNLYYYEPSTFRLLRKQGVTDGGSLAFNLNEIEFIDGYIYANQWQYPYVLKIDPASGNVVAKADLTEVWNRIKAKDPASDVPNGIAYDPVSKKMYVTGKLWPELYEIQFSQ